MKASFEIKGFDELAKQLRGMSRAVAGPIASKSVLAGLEAGQKHIVASCPDSIKYSIGYRLVRKRGTSLMGGKIGVNVGLHNDFRSGTQWAAALVLGTQPRFRKTKTGKLASTGRILANTAVSAAIASVGPVILDATHKFLSSELAKYN